MPTPVLGPDRQFLTVPIARKTVNELRELARREDTTMSEIVRRLIRQALTEKRSPGVVSAGAESQSVHGELYDKNRITG